MADANGSAAVEQNLDHAAETETMNGAAHAATEAHGGPAAHAPDPAIAGVLDSTVIVSAAMAVLIAIMIWKKVPAAIGAMLDKRIGEIRTQLDEAASLRREAEALKTEYERKMAQAEVDAEAMIARARQEAAEAVEDAKAQAAEIIARRQKMAEDKIAGAERAAIAEIRALAVETATSAAARLIGQHHDAAADAAMVERSIKGIGTAH